MRVIHSENKLDYLERTANGYLLNFNQRKVTIEESDQVDVEDENSKKSKSKAKTKTVYEIYQETFDRFPSLRSRLETVKSAARDYAKSVQVKRFTIGNTAGWLDSEQRASIMDSVSAAEKAGEENYTLWVSNHPFTLSLSRVREIVSAIELYSNRCYNVTSRYLQQIEDCKADTEKACEIDFTVGYPTLLSFEYEQ